MLLRSSRIKDRIFTLINTYYLGKLLETETSTLVQRSQLRELLTKYYGLISIRTYYLFKALGVNQIQRTWNVTLKDIYRLSSNSYQFLVDEATNIWTTSNLEGRLKPWSVTAAIIWFSWQIWQIGHIWPMIYIYHIYNIC